MARRNPLLNQYVIDLFPRHGRVTWRCAKRTWGAGGVGRKRRSSFYFIRRAERGICRAPADHRRGAGSGARGSSKSGVLRATGESLRSVGGALQAKRPVWEGSPSDREEHPGAGRSGRASDDLAVRRRIRRWFRFRVEPQQRSRGTPILRRSADSPCRAPGARGTSCNRAAPQLSQPGASTHSCALVSSTVGTWRERRSKCRQAALRATLKGHVGNNSWSLTVPAGERMPPIGA